MAIETEDSQRKHLTFHYRGMFDDGSVFIDSTKGNPMEIETGAHAVMPQLEEALCKLAPDEEDTVFVGKAYGDYDEGALCTRIMRYTIPNGDKLQEGQEIMWTSPQNPTNPIPARIARADDYSFDIDFNHPLAGKELTYWVKLLAVD